MISHSRPTIEKNEIADIAKCLKSKQIAAGKINFLFADKLKKFFKAKEVLITPSGTEAIIQALKLLNLTNQDEVIISAYVCENVARAIKTAGAIPKVVDINRDDYNISYHETIKKISKKTKAIIAPSVFGNTVKDIKKFLKLGIPIIEDIAQSIGGTYKDKKLGTFSDMAICSFYATKVITSGEGGALILNSSKLAKKINKEKIFYKMPDFQAVLGLSQLRKVNKFIAKRKSIAKQYIKNLKNIPTIRISKPQDSIFYRFVIEVDNPHKVIKKLKSNGIEAKRYTEIVLNYLKLNADDYPNTKKAIERALSIPIYPSLSNRDVNYIIKHIQKVLQEIK